MNSRWRKLNQVLITSGSGKVQPDFDVYMLDGDLDTQENCQIETNIDIEYGEQRNCSKEDLIGQPVRKRRRQFRLTFTDPTPHQMFKYQAYKEGAVTSPTGVPANEVQTLSYSGSVTGGTFPLSLSNFEGRSGSTRQIPFNASPAVIQAAIIDQAHSLGKIIKPGDVTVTGSWGGGGIVVTFGKRLRNANLPLLVVDNSLIDGGGTIQVAETTAGANNYHTAQRSADGSKPQFGFALADKSSTVATRKYGNAVVSSTDFTTTNDQTNVQLVVVIDCSYLEGEVTSIPVPACVNAPAVLAEDTRIKIAGNYEHRDLVSHAISLNDNVPVRAAHAFDDMDITRPFQRGNQPTQEKRTEIFADTNHALYTLADQCFIEGNEVEFITHFGNPGNRFSVIAPETKIKPDGNKLEDFSGELDESTLKLNGTPFGITDIPVTYELYGDQNTPFLQVSE